MDSLVVLKSMQIGTNNASIMSLNTYCIKRTDKLDVFHMEKIRKPNKNVSLKNVSPVLAYFGHQNVPRVALKRSQGLNTSYGKY